MVDRWENASSYDRFMGRWSRVLARDFVAWIGARSGAAWLEIGCGTGALTEAILATAEPASLVACDTSPDYVRYCREHLRHPSLTVTGAVPGRLPESRGGFDFIASSLVLNFLPEPVAALRQMREACVTGGVVAACVWDYSHGMEFLRTFWDAAVALDPAARALDEGERFPICHPEALEAALTTAGLESATVAPITIDTTFASFDEYWQPFINGPGPAPTYVSTLSEPARRELAERLRDTLGPVWPVSLAARAWAARGLRP